MNILYQYISKILIVFLNMYVTKTLKNHLSKIFTRTLHINDLNKKIKHVIFLCSLWVGYKFFENPNS